MTEKRRFSSTDPGRSLDEKRLDKVPHKPVTLHRSLRKECDWCKFKKHEARLEKKTPARQNPVKTQRSCSHCQPLTICKEHWDKWHNNDDG